MKKQIQQLIQAALFAYIAICVVYFGMLVYQLEWKPLPEAESSIPILDSAKLTNIDALLRTRLPQSLGVDYSTPSAILGKPEPFSK